MDGVSESASRRLQRGGVDGRSGGDGGWWVLRQRGRGRSVVGKSYGRARRVKAQSQSCRGRVQSLAEIERAAPCSLLHVVSRRLVVGGGKMGQFGDT